MKRHIERIRQQPEHIRQLGTLGCTAVVGLFVIAIWFHSFQTTGYALLNPDQATQGGDTSQFAKQSNQSLFASIGQSFKDGAAAIGQVWTEFHSSQPATTASQSSETSTQATGSVNPLPLSGNK